MNLILEPLAAQINWTCQTAIGMEEVGEIIRSFIESLTQQCAANENAVIGHIKSLSIFPGGGYLRCSAVSDKLPMDMEISSDSPKNVSIIPLSLNVIVYDLPHSKAKEILFATAGDIASQHNLSVALESVSQPGQDSHDHS
jgi:hypothetical protein